MNEPTTKKYRVVRGCPNKYTGKMFAMGMNYTTTSAQAAVDEDTATFKKPDGFWVAAEPLPVIAVYEMTPVTDWVNR